MVRGRPAAQLRNVVERTVILTPRDQLGTIEADMIGIAAGLALKGCRPFAYTIATFSLYRPFEMVRDDLGYQNLPVTVVGIGGIVARAPAGARARRWAGSRRGPSDRGRTVVTEWSETGGASSSPCSGASLQRPSHLQCSICAIAGCKRGQCRNFTSLADRLARLSPSPAGNSFRFAAPAFGFASTLRQILQILQLLLKCRE